MSLYHGITGQPQNGQTVLGSLHTTADKNTNAVRNIQVTPSRNYAGSFVPTTQESRHSAVYAVPEREGSFLRPHEPPGNQDIYPLNQSWAGISGYGCDQRQPQVLAGYTGADLSTSHQGPSYEPWPLDDRRYYGSTVYSVGVSDANDSFPLFQLQKSQHTNVPAGSSTKDTDWDHILPIASSSNNLPSFAGSRNTAIPHTSASQCEDVACQPFHQENSTSLHVHSPSSAELYPMSWTNEMCNKSRAASGQVRTPPYHSDQPQSTSIHCEPRHPPITRRRYRPLLPKSTVMDPATSTLVQSHEHNGSTRRAKDASSSFNHLTDGCEQHSYHHSPKNSDLSRQKKSPPSHTVSKKTVPSYVALRQEAVDSSLGLTQQTVPKEFMQQNPSTTTNTLQTEFADILHCPQCETPFTGLDRRSNRQRHIRSIHDNPRRFVCPAEGCSKDYSRQDNLSKHHRTSH